MGLAVGWRHGFFVAEIYLSRYTSSMNPIRELRTAVGLTQQQLATAAGTSQSAVAAYEGDRKSPTWRTVERLAHAVGCRVELRYLPPLTREDRRSLALHAAVPEHVEWTGGIVVVCQPCDFATLNVRNP